jgi:hypothetical protein
MPVFFGFYKISPNPPTEAWVKQLEAFAASIRMQTQMGDIREAHAFVGALGGYFITGDISPERLDQNLALYFPWVTFETHEMIPVELALKNAIGAAKTRAGMT